MAVVLVTGGTGVVGNAAVGALLKKGHRVRLLTRHADVDSRVWPEGVQPRVGDVTTPEGTRDAADGCDAVVHIAGAVRDMPEATVHEVNVHGTRHVAGEAARAGVRRFVFVSSSGADSGSSEYHRSKWEAETIVHEHPGEWVILRPGMVYGPGDEVISVLLRMMRSLPAIPVVGRARTFQPIWHEDLAAAIAAAVERNDVVGRTLELGGTETTTVDDVLDRLERLTERAPARLPLPSFAAKLGAHLPERFEVGALLAGLTRLAMLEEESAIRVPEGNALGEVFGIRPTPLDEGLARLAQDLPEQLPEDGRGPLERKRFWVVLHDARLDAKELMRVFRGEAGSLLPLEFGANGAPEDPLEPGMTLTMELPLRGEVQVRVEEATDDHVTLATLEGHPLAGIVRFIARPDDQGICFMIEVFARSANLLDRLVMKSGGAAMQRSTWHEAVERVVARAGGIAPDGVCDEVTRLEGAEADAVEAWVAAMVAARKRDENARSTGRSGGGESLGAAESPEPAA